jgi:NAD(P)-dependent dehydrogenase (short-subunit alcohol dehydrogenase family)
MEGKTSVVVGASRGIGKAIAVALAAEGAHVVAVASSDANPRFAGTLRATVEEIRRRGGSAGSLCCDIGDTADVTALVEQVLSEHGKIDVLFNSAVSFLHGSPFETTDEAWDRAIDVNLTGAFRLTRAVAPSMIARRSGHIIHLTGTAAHDVSVGETILGACKAALERFTQGVAEDLRPHNVAANLFDPDKVRTDRLLAVLGPDYDWRGWAPPDAIADAAVHLAMQDAGSMTGQVFRYLDHAAHSTGTSKVTRQGYVDGC